MGQTKTLAKNLPKSPSTVNLFGALMARFSSSFFFLFFQSPGNLLEKAPLEWKLGKFNLETIPTPSKTLSHWWSTWWIKKNHPFSNKPNKNTLQIMAKTTFTSTGGFFSPDFQPIPPVCVGFPHVKGWRFLASAKRRRCSQAMSLSDWVFCRKNLWKLGENKLSKASKETSTNQPRKRRFWIFKKKLDGFFGRCFSFFVSEGYLFLVPAVYFP